jgi:hypothetical protein
MKYIPGYSFTVGEALNANGGSLVGAQNQKAKIAKVAKQFKVGATYKIFYIKPQSDKITYTFIGPSNTRFEEEFKTREDAESKIDFLRGE